jgi:hypothetical protein
MIRRAGLLSSLLVFLTVSALRAQSPGHVNFSRLTDASFNWFTDNPSPAMEQWLRSHFMRMGVYTSYFDSKTSWYQGAQVYLDLFGIKPTDLVRWQHPEWIMHDQWGNWLYVNYNCANGSCPQLAGDISIPGFRAWWIQQAQAVVSRGNYPAIWIDDVDTNFSVSNGWGNQAAPMDYATGQPMTWAAWRGYIAQFTKEIRAAFPNTELVENTVWFAGPNGIRDADPAIQQQIATATNINLERGVGSDPGLTGGTGPWSVYALFAYIDRVHALGPGVTLEQYNISPAQQYYSLAAYYMISNGNDRYDDSSTSPNYFWGGFYTELGTPLGPRTYNNGVFQRNYSGGIVLMGEPGLNPTWVNLPGTYMTLDGFRVNSVMVYGWSGIILFPAN